MKKNKKRWIITVSAVVCLLAILLVLGCSGGGTLVETKTLPIRPPIAEPDNVTETAYDVYAGLRVHTVTVVAATPWGILIRCSFPENYTVRWYQNGSNAYEVTEEAVTKWKFLGPGEAFHLYYNHQLITCDGTFMTYTYIQD